MADFNLEGQDQIKIPTILCGALYFGFLQEEIGKLHLVSCFDMLLGILIN